MDFLRASVYILAFGGAFLIWIFKKQLQTSFIWVGWYLLFNGISQLAAYLLALYAKNNILWYNIALLIDFGLIFSILYFLLAQNRYRKILVLIFTIGAVFFFYFLVPLFFELFASRALSILNLTAIMGCMMYFYELLKIPERIPITQQGKFWIGTGFLVYYVSSFSMWLIFELMAYNHHLAFFSVVNIWSVILLYVILIVATIIQVKNPQHAQH